MAEEWRCAPMRVVGIGGVGGNPGTRAEGARSGRMKDIEVKFHWKFAGPLHVGVGLSAAGYADRLVRLLNGMPQIPGEAVKGAIRGSAERIARWLEGIEGAEAEDNSAPRNRVLQRLF